MNLFVWLLSASIAWGVLTLIISSIAPKIFCNEEDIECQISALLYPMLISWILMGIYQTGVFWRIKNIRWNGVQRR
jgi:hypothetical protein